MGTINIRKNAQIYNFWDHRKKIIAKVITVKQLCMLAYFIVFAIAVRLMDKMVLVFGCFRTLS